MSWNTVIVTVSCTAMDPGIRTASSSSKQYYREVIKEGQPLPFNDPSGTLPAIKVLELRENSLKIEVGKEKVFEVEPDKTVLLCNTGYNYAYFDLEILLIQKDGPDQVSIWEPLEVANDRYKVFAISPQDIAELKRIEAKRKVEDLGYRDRDSLYLLGQWYWLTRPDEDSVRKAKEIFQYTSMNGCTDALMGLANMYRYGGMGDIDLDEYGYIRAKALRNGSMAAELAYCQDLADGVECEADLAAAEELAKSHLWDKTNAKAEWLDAMGWVLLKQGRRDEAIDMFNAAAGKGFRSAYEGLLSITHAPDVMVRAKRDGCGRVYSVMAEEDIARYNEAQEESVKAELAGSIVKNYEKALQWGDVSAANALTRIYREGLFGIKPLVR